MRTNSFFKNESSVTKRMVQITGSVASSSQMLGFFMCLTVPTYITSLSGLGRPNKSLTTL